MIKLRRSHAGITYLRITVQLLIKDHETNKNMG
jgi:hypothetical protein